MAFSTGNCKDAKHRTRYLLMCRKLKYTIKMWNAFYETFCKIYLCSYLSPPFLCSFQKKVASNIEYFEPVQKVEWYLQQQKFVSFCADCFTVKCVFIHKVQSSKSGTSNMILKFEITWAKKCLANTSENCACIKCSTRGKCDYERNDVNENIPV